MLLEIKTSPYWFYAIQNFFPRGKKKKLAGCLINYKAELDLNFRMLWPFHWAVKEDCQPLFSVCVVAHTGSSPKAADD